MILTGDKEFYKGIGAITFEGKESDNPLSFKYYDPERKVWTNQDGNGKLKRAFNQFIMDLVMQTI